MTVILRGTRIPRNLRKDSNFQAEIYWKTDEEALAETTQILESLQARSPRLVKEALAGLGDDWRIWMHDPENALKELDKCRRIRRQALLASGRRNANDPR